MTEYNNRVQDQVLSLIRGSTDNMRIWDIKYKKAVRTKYPRGRVLQRLAELEITKYLSTITDSTKSNRLKSTLKGNKNERI